MIRASWKLNFSEPVTNYAVGWRDPNDIQASLQFIAPSVLVGRRFEGRGEQRRGVFSRCRGMTSAPSARTSNAWEYTATDVTDRRLNKGLTYIADLDNVSGPNWRTDKVAKLLRGCFAASFVAHHGHRPRPPRTPH